MNIRDAEVILTEYLDTLKWTQNLETDTEKWMQRQNVIDALHTALEVVDAEQRRPLVYREKTIKALRSWIMRTETAGKSGGYAEAIAEIRAIMNNIP